MDVEIRFLSVLPPLLVTRYIAGLGDQHLTINVLDLLSVFEIVTLQKESVDHTLTLHFILLVMDSKHILDWAHHVLIVRFGEVVNQNLFLNLL